MLAFCFFGAGRQDATCPIFASEAEPKRRKKTCERRFLFLPLNAMLSFADPRTAINRTGGR